MSTPAASAPAAKDPKEATKDKSKKDKTKKGGKPGEPDVELGPDGKPIPPVPLTETEMVQLQVENKVSEVCIISFNQFLFIWNKHCQIGNSYFLSF